MTQEQFLEQISPLPEHDYMYFVKADMSLGQFSFSRAYINFTEQQDIFMFREKFDNYVFVDSKGTEYPAVVEFAPFQRLPKKRVGKKKDLKCGTIESDSYYISFLENLKNQEVDSSVTQSKTEYSYQPPDSEYFSFWVFFLFKQRDIYVLYILHIYTCKGKQYLKIIIIVLYRYSEEGCDNSTARVFENT